MRSPESTIGFRQSIERVKREIPLTEYIARHCPGTELRSVGSRMTGRCPLPDHDDGTPSFQVYLSGDGPDSWWCFGCSRGSDILDLHQYLYDHAEKWTALVELAMEHGVELEPSDQWKAKQDRQKPIRDGLTKVKIRSAHRRLYRIMEPFVLAIDDADERRVEAERVWRDLEQTAWLMVQRSERGMVTESETAELPEDYAARRQDRGAA